MIALFITALIALDLAVSARAILSLYRRAVAWRQVPRPFACVACHVAYSDARALSWHRQGQHVETYDNSRA